jgi:hypothetical protein
MTPISLLSSRLASATDEKERTAPLVEMMALFPGHVFRPMTTRNGWWDESAVPDNVTLRVAVGSEIWCRKVGETDEQGT